MGNVVYDFPVSDAFARYEAWLNGETLPALMPEEPPPPLPERGAFNRAFQGNLSYPIVRSIFQFNPAPPKKRPRQRGGLDV